MQTHEIHPREGRAGPVAPVGQVMGRAASGRDARNGECEENAPGCQDPSRHESSARHTPLRGTRPRQCESQGALGSRTIGQRIVARLSRRSADFIIGGVEKPYLMRWWVIPRNRFFNVYLHRFMRSDDDRALHDHPWANVSVLLVGRYVEHRIRAGGTEVRTERHAGSVVARLPRTAHRIELIDGPCWTLFITGPKVRAWGFHCRRRWVPWQEFTAEHDSGAVGKGCSD